MYPVQQPNVVTMQPSIVQEDPLPRPRQKARALVGFGIAQLVLSVILFCWSWWMLTLTVDSTFPIGYVTMFCSLYHVAVSILAIVGGNDAGRLRCCVVSCMVLAIIGACIICVITIIPNFSIWTSESFDCQRCDEFSSEKDHDVPSWENHCDDICAHGGAIFVGSGLFVFILAVIDIVISSVTCCNVCRCCGCCYVDTSTPGYVLQPPHNPHVYNQHGYAQHGYAPHAYNPQVYASETAPLPAYEHPPPQEPPNRAFNAYPPAYNQMA